MKPVCASPTCVRGLSQLALQAAKTRRVLRARLESFLILTGDIAGDHHRSNAPGNAAGSAREAWAAVAAQGPAASAAVDGSERYTNPLPPPPPFTHGLFMRFYDLCDIGTRHLVLALLLLSELKN